MNNNNNNTNMDYISDDDLDSNDGWDVPTTYGASTPSQSNPHNQPHQPSSASKSKSGSSHKSKSDGSGSRGRKSSFTGKMKDRQARNKDPYQSSDESEDEMWGSSSKKKDFYGTESYETVQKRREAAIILDSPELLMMHAQARSDSIPSTRLYFMKMLAGFLTEKDAYPFPPAAMEELRTKARKVGK